MTKYAVICKSNVEKFFEYYIKFKKNMGQSRPLFVYFRPFHITNQSQIEKSIDGLLGIRTRGRRMEGTDKTTELWRPPILYEICEDKIKSYIHKLPFHLTKKSFAWKRDSFLPVVFSTLIPLASSSQTFIIK